MDYTTKQKLCVYSSNSRGSSQDKLTFIQSLINLSGSKIPIFCLQEYFLLRGSLRKLSSFFKESSVIAKPAYKDLSIQMKGRAKVRLATIVPKSMRKNIIIQL